MATSTYAVVASLIFQLANAVFFAINQGSTEFKLGKTTIKPGGFIERKEQPRKKSFKVISNGIASKIKLVEGTAGEHTGVLADDAGAAAVDTNDVQVALSNAAMDCKHEDWVCVASKTFGGYVPQDFARRMFNDLWGTWAFWSQCIYEAPSPVLRTIQTKTGHNFSIYRERPLVGTVANFMTAAECQEVVMEKGNIDQLVQAHVGSGGGGTSTSSARETLTNNIFVNWDVEDIVSRVAKRLFDLSSEMLGEDLNYEGQEPINLLHYVKGFEYRPHHDGMSGTKPPKGKRIGTTLVYCEAADEGGGTVFPTGVGKVKVKFQPTPGSVLFFAYNPDLRGEATHAACPVIAGNKTTLTQWYRRGTSSTKNWDEYEAWGKFYNPYQSSVWKGHRFKHSNDAEL